MKVKAFGPGVEPGEKCWVGIDQSFSGFAVTVLAANGSYKTTVAKLDDGGVRRLVAAQEYLKHCLQSVGVENILDTAMEGYAYGSIMANTLGELGGVVKTTLYQTLDKGKYPLIVPPTTLKKYVTGKGTGVQKNQMLLHTYKKWGVEMLDDNACDSFGLAKLVSGKPTLAYEKEIWDKMQDAKHREQ